jgi:16S rRNA (guanine966-N2)-methyltransferase
MKTNQPPTKKIIAGKFKGKTLKIPSHDTTRSSKAIVLESFFNTLQFEIIDSVFVELFSGSGSVGLEALSRGAKSVIFMERDFDAIKILKSNIAQTDPEHCSVISGDSFVNFSSVIRELKNEKKNVYFFIDPPFAYREGMEDIYEKMITLIENIPQDIVKLITIEHMSTLIFDEKIGNFVKLKSKKFGKTSLTYYGDDHE